jgi:MYXO-CTERM domain-containing protein
MSGRKGFFATTLIATAIASSSAHAQAVVTPVGPAVKATAAYPVRVLPDGTELGPSTRPPDLSPHGIDYQDCIDDQTLRFTVTLTGFTGESLQVWASQSADCTQDAARGVGAPATCWVVGAGLAGLVTPSPLTEMLDVRVEDLVGWQSAPPGAPGYQRLGPSACIVQPTFTAVPLTLYFIPVVGDSFESGAAALTYTVGTDLVGPPAPAGVSLGDGAGLFVVDWTANADSDTVGYDILLDPLPGATVDASATSACGAFPASVVRAGAAGLTVPGESAGTYTITGLSSSARYAVAIAAVDAYGNLGPPSVALCDQPGAAAPGAAGASGCACALGAPGAPGASTFAVVPVLALVSASLRRRRRRRRFSLRARRPPARSA